MFLLEIDLHLHSTASDGVTSPSELVGMAKKMGLCAISITDHDSVAGLTEGMREGSKWDVEVVPGIEIGSYSGDRSIHILGYFIDPDSPALRDFASQKREARLCRAREMVNRLRSAGMPIDIDSVLKVAQGGVLGRMHIARVLAANGVVGSVKEGFQKLLRRGSPYYVAMPKPTPQQAISLIEQAGGIASLAHPVFLSDGLLEALMPALLQARIGAIEVLCGFDPDYGLSAEEHLRRCSTMTGFAADHDLARTGGSDFHGLSVKAADMGSAHVPVQFLHELKQKHRTMFNRL